MQQNSPVLKIKNSNFLENKNFLITGASGLIGINILQTLLINGVQGKRLTAQYKTCFSADQQKKLENYGVKLIKCNLVESNHISEEKFDYIIHAATYGQPGKYLNDRIDTIKLNTETILNLTKNLKKTGTLLFVSSSDVYNGSINFPLKEDDLGYSNPWHSRSAYFEGKRCGEAICSALINHGINIKVARLALGYGPGFKLDDKRVMYEFAISALRNRRITLKDQGTAMRTYGYVSDIVEMLLNILFESKTNLYNVGGNSRISILNLAKTIAKYNNSEVIIPIEDSKEEQIKNAPNDVWLDLTKYCTEFNKNQFVSIDDGTIIVMDWAKYILKKSNVL